MYRSLENAVNSWLRAESGDDPNRAENALRRVFLHLPRYAPPAGLVEAVLERLGLPPAGLLSPPRWTLRWKAALGVSFALAALAIGVLPRFLAALWTGLGPGVAIDLGAGVLVGVSARLAEGIAVWGALSDVARAVSASLASPTTGAALAAAALISALALRLLHTLMLPERNVRHAQPH